MSYVIVPVGLNLGPSYRYVTPPDPTPEYWEVRLGDESEHLTADEFTVWATAFLDPERHAQLKVSHASLLIDLARAAEPVPDPDAIIERLIERRLLVEFDTDGSLERVFRRIQLFPCAEGMGNTPDEPDRRHIGHHGQSLLKTNYTVYGMWAFSAITSPSLWEACAEFELGAQEQLAAGADIEDTKASEVAHELAITIPMMIALGCAFLDIVR